jgi:thiol-disulfide isomerase/thioredoxin
LFTFAASAPKIRSLIDHARELLRALDGRRKVYNVLKGERKQIAIPSLRSDPTRLLSELNQKLNGRRFYFSPPANYDVILDTVSSRMRRSFLWFHAVDPRVSLAVLLLGILAACGTQPPSHADAGNSTAVKPAAAASSVGNPVPPSTIPARSRAGSSGYGFTLLDNRRMNLSDYAGQVVIVDFWATFCPPCREETPHLVDLQRRYASKGLHIIGLNVGGPDDRDKVQGFIAQFKIPKEYTLGFPDPEMASLYLSDDDSIPQAFVFDRKRQLVKRFIGYDQTVPAELEQIVQTALAASAN